jgi:hypothetical protein
VRLTLAGTATALSVALVLTVAPAQAADPFPAEEETAIVAIVEEGMAEQRQPGLNVGPSASAISHRRRH